jgi:hypothetical protein
MEAAVALGVVSSIIAIAQLTTKLTITTGKLINSAGDSLPENEWIEEVAQTNRDLTTDLNDASNAAGPLSKIDSTVAKLARRCLDESAALTKILQDLKVPLRSDGTKSKRGAAKAVFRTLLKNGDLGRRHKRLISLERQLAALLLYAIKTSLLQGFEELRDSVERNGRDCVAVVRDSHTLMIEKLTALELGIRTVGEGVGRLEQGVDRVQEGVGRVEEGVGRVEQRQLNDIEQRRVEDLLQSLTYNGMDSRRDMIVDPVGSTYDWAFEDTKQSTKQWLDSSVQHCWTSGEPGTGKSVFTKHFRVDNRTLVALRTHAGNDKLLILDHYFWIAGDSDQRSLRTMLQHFCFQALQQYSILAKVAFPDEWKSGMPVRGMTWTTRTLVTALKRILAASGFQTCIMIDGIDECEDKQRSELIQLLLDIAKTTPVRLCVSSRPWSDFEKAFDNWPRLKLPENNAWDIFQLICRRLELADDSTFRDCVEDVRLFDITCAGRDRTIQYGDKYTHNRDSLNPSHRLIHDLCVKTDGNILWVTCVLDTVSQRLADGQSADEVMRYIVDLPRDFEDYYYELVYSQIHSTYRTGNMSECAMALKVVTCMEESDIPPVVERFELIWALQTSISTGSGIACDPDFFTKPWDPDTERPLDAKAYQTVCAFVNSRCKDLMVTSMSPRNNTGFLEYQHRVIYDFVSSEKMQSAVNSAVPEHFRAPQFGFHLGILATGRLHERLESEIHVEIRSPTWGLSATNNCQIALKDHLERHIAEGKGSLDQTAIKTCDETARAMLRSVPGKAQYLQQLALNLVRVQEFGLISDIIDLGSKETVGHIKPAYVNQGEELDMQSWLGRSPLPIRQVVSTCEPDTQDIDSTLRRLCYLPCINTCWTALLHHAVSYVKLEDDEGPV